MKKTTAVIAIIGMSFFLSGCSLAPKYVRPKSPVPQSFPAGDAYVQPSAGKDIVTVDGLGWRDIVSDKKLQQVVELALLNNRDLKIAVLNVEKARGLYGIQRAELFPAVELAADTSKKRVPADLSGVKAVTHPEQYDVKLGITSWEVDLFGRIRNLKQQALQEYLATEQAQRAARTTLIKGVLGAYMTLAADRENLKWIRATLELQRNVYWLVWQRYDQGLVSETDIHRVQAQVDSLVRAVAFYTQIVAQDRNALDLLVGSPVPEELLPVDFLSVAPLKDISAGLSSEVLLRRPDIMGAEYRLKAAYAFIGAARAAFFPQISLTTALGTASKDLSNLFSPGSRAWSFATSSAVSVFDMRTRAAYKVSKVERDIALAEYEKAIQTAFREASDALAARSMADRQVESQEALVASAQRIYDLSVQRYNQGLDGYLNVLDAQRTLYSGYQELTSLYLAKALDQINLYAVLGGDNAQ